ncbi:MAG TPA: hypothetical protein VL463_35155 [Kofleriaceae bacterium]|nr:hypothetical protein [Kofleriaceae bacterium]
MRWLMCVLMIAACDGKTGTYHVSLVTAPGSHVLDAVTRAKLVLTDPFTIVESDRGADGSFALDLSVDAHGTNAVILFEGLDANQNVIAWGRTPGLPVAAIDASLAIDVAPPLSFTAAPAALDPPRAELGVAPLAYGVLFAGGADATGAPRADVVVYNSYDHVLQKGLDLPAPRAALSAMTGSTGYTYFFGGRDAAGQPTSTFWRFDTTVAPAGAYLDLSDMSMASYARAGASATPIGGELFVVAGTPPVLLDGTTTRTAAVSTPPAIGGLATSVIVGTNEEAVFVGEGAGATGIAIFSATGYVEVAAPADAIRTGHGIAAADDGSILEVGGAVQGTLVASGLRIDPVGPAASSIANVLETPRKDAAVAAVGTLLVVAGGTDASGNVLANAEILDLPTLTHHATIPLAVPRTGAQAITLPDGQVLVAGGRDMTGAPIGTIELFTGPVPALQ